MNKEEFYEALNRNREHALEHHGIKGQKWGLRRFQNPDGTLTPAGRARYLKALSTYQRNAGNAERSVVGSAVKSAALGSAAGAGAAIVGGGDIGVSALLSGGASALLGGTVAAAKNAITGAKLNKAIAIMEQFKQMYGDKSVYEVTKDPKLESKDDSDNLIRDAKNNNAGFYAEYDKEPVSVKAKEAYNNFKSGVYNKEVEDAAAKIFYKEYKDWYENYYSDMKTGAITKTLSEQQFRNDVLPKMRKSALISNEGNIQFDLDHRPGTEDPLAGHALGIRMTTDSNGKRRYEDDGING